MTDSLIFVRESHSIYIGSNGGLEAGESIISKVC